MISFLTTHTTTVPFEIYLTLLQESSIFNFDSSLQSKQYFGGWVLNIILVENYSCHLWFLQQWKSGERKKYVPMGVYLDQKREGRG